MTDDQQAIVAGSRKLLYNVEHLLEARNGCPRPVMFHVCLTNRCQLKCSFCCYGDRKSNEELPLEALKHFARDSKQLNVNAWELTGGGEPLLHPQVNDLIDFLVGLRIKVGLMTNGLALNRLRTPELLSWVRVSLHAIDQGRAAELAERISLVRDRVKTTCCWVVSTTNKHLLPTVIEFATVNQIAIKVEPSYYQAQEEVLSLVEWLCSELRNTANVFLNFHTAWDRQSSRCYLHLIKPFLYTDGWLCDCPLPVGLERTIDPKFHLCRMEDVVAHYRSCGLIRHHDCAFCRYTEHNAIAEGVMRPLADCEFC